MSIYNNGNTVTWGKNNKEWYVIGEYNDYYILILKESEDEAPYDFPGTTNGNTYPAEWSDLWITGHLRNWGDENFSDSDKESMLSETCVKAQGGPYLIGYSFKLYATLLTASQVDMYLPKYSSVRGRGWWIKKTSVDVSYNGDSFNNNIIVSSDGFSGSSLDTDRGFRPAIGVKKQALANKYPNITSTVSASADSSSGSSSYSSNSNYSSSNSNYSSSSYDTQKIISWIFGFVSSIVAAIILSSWLPLVFIPGWFLICYNTISGSNGVSWVGITMGFGFGCLVGLVAWIFAGFSTGLTLLYYIASICADIGFIVYLIKER